MFYKALVERTFIIAGVGILSPSSSDNILHL